MKEAPKSGIPAGRYDVAPEQGAHNEATLPVEKLTSEHILQRAPEAGGTTITHIRHGRYERDAKVDSAGSITPEAASELQEFTAGLVGDIVASVPEDERDQLRFLFVASPTYYLGNEDLGQRSMETGQVMADATKATLSELGLNPNQILNFSDEARLHPDRKENSEGMPRPIQDLEEPRVFSENQIAFAHYICEQETQRLRDAGELKEGEEVQIGSLPFFIAFEEDHYKEKRLEMGAEGAHDMGDRIADRTKVLARYASMYHERENNENTRLIIVAASHYDVISPYVKDHIIGMDEETSNKTLLQVDYGGGITVEIGAENRKQGTVNIAGKVYEPINLQT